MKQERELADISKKADRRDHSRETLEARPGTRKTRRGIENVLLEMGKRGMEGRDSGGGASAPGSAARPPEHLSPTPPSLPPETPQATGVSTQATPLHREAKRRKVENPKEEPENTRLPPVHSFCPTVVLDFDPSRPPPVRGECVREQVP